MRNLAFIFVAVVLVAACVTSRAQSSQRQADASATVLTNTADVYLDDPKFAGFGRLTKGMRPPKATHAPDPKFPELPPDSEQRGLVVMVVGINAKGRVEPVHVVRSTAQVFEQSAVETVKKWRFRPAQKDGKPIPVQVTVEMKFER